MKPAVEKPLDHLADDLAPVTPAPRDALIIYRVELVKMILDYKARCRSRAAVASR